VEKTAFFIESWGRNNVRPRKRVECYESLTTREFEDREHHARARQGAVSNRA